jgi:hypothetical protein
MDGWVCWWVSECVEKWLNRLILVKWIKEQMDRQVDNYG